MLGSVDRFVDAATYVGRRQARHRSSAPSARVAGGAPRRPRRPRRHRARKLTDTVGSVGRLLAPATQPLSPVMADRSLSVRFSTLVRPLDDLKAAAKAADGKLNDAFVAAVAGGPGRATTSTSARRSTRCA